MSMTRRARIDALTTLAEVAVAVRCQPDLDRETAAIDERSAGR